MEKHEITDTDAGSQVTSMMEKRDVTDVGSQLTSMMEKRDVTDAGSQLTTLLTQGHN